MSRAESVDTILGNEMPCMGAYQRTPNYTRYMGAEPLALFHPVDLP